MVPELEKPRVTEIKVRMDCNGCVQKIKKALHGINGIYDIYIDAPEQKLTIIGWADPEKVIKAIKKTRKTATICSHSEPSDQQPQPTDPPQPDQPPEQQPDPANPPPPTESPPADPTKDPPPPKENPPPNAANDASASHPGQSSRPKDVEEVHVIYHHPPDYGYRHGYGHNYANSYGGQRNNYQNGPGFRQEPLPPQTQPPPVHEPAPVYVTRSYETYRPSANVTHCYNTYRPSPYVTHTENAYRPSPNVSHSFNTYRPSPYVSEHEYIRSPPPEMHYSRPERFRYDYDNTNYGGNGNISSVFSDENPNACRIV